jgi:S-adenosylmethionine:tRNA-ribosyltransferase-isomerase (queuine synthetase)
MSKPIIKKVDLGEYLVVIKYSGEGDISVDILDELGDIIEGIYISSESDDNDKFDFNLN